jgi:hypothetical protein
VVAFLQCGGRAHPLLSRIGKTLPTSTTQGFTQIEVTSFSKNAGSRKTPGTHPYIDFQNRILRGGSEKTWWGSNAKMRYSIL